MYSCLEKIPEACNFPFLIFLLRHFNAIVIEHFDFRSDKVCKNVGQIVQKQKLSLKFILGSDKSLKVVFGI